MPPSGACWAQLRALVAAYHPNSAHVLGGLEMAAQPRTAAVAQEYLRSGTGQLANLQISLRLQAATVVSQAARHLCGLPGSAQRLEGLLRDAATLR